MIEALIAKWYYAVKCPVCGSLEREVRCCIVENCSEPHELPSAYSVTHKKVICSHPWHEIEREL